MIPLHEDFCVANGGAFFTIKANVTGQVWRQAFMHSWGVKCQEAELMARLITDNAFGGPGT